MPARAVLSSLGRLMGPKEEEGRGQRRQGTERMRACSHARGRYLPSASPSPFLHISAHQIACVGRCAPGGL